MSKITSESKYAATDPYCADSFKNWTREGGGSGGGGIIEIWRESEWVSEWRDKENVIWNKNMPLLIGKSANS